MEEEAAIRDRESRIEKAVDTTEKKNAMDVVKATEAEVAKV